MSFLAPVSNWGQHWGVNLARNKRGLTKKRRRIVQGGLQKQATKKSKKKTSPNPPAGKGSSMTSRWTWEPKFLQVQTFEMKKKTVSTDNLLSWGREG